MNFDFYNDLLNEGGVDTNSSSNNPSASLEPADSDLFNPTNINNNGFDDMNNYLYRNQDSNNPTKDIISPNFSTDEIINYIENFPSDIFSSFDKENNQQISDYSPMNNKNILDLKPSFNTNSNTMRSSSTEGSLNSAQSSNSLKTQNENEGTVKKPAKKQRRKRTNKAPSPDDEEEELDEKLVESITREDGTEVRYAPIACVYCRRAHRRCDRLFPTCTECLKNGKQCSFRKPRKRGRKANKNKLEKTNNSTYHPYSTNNNTSENTPNNNQQNSLVLLNEENRKIIYNHANNFDYKNFVDFEKIYSSQKISSKQTLDINFWGISQYCSKWYFERFSLGFPLLSQERFSAIVSKIQSISKDEYMPPQQEVDVALVHSILLICFQKFGQKQIADELYQRCRVVVGKMFDQMYDLPNVACIMAALAMYLYGEGETVKAAIFEGNVSLFLKHFFMHVLPGGCSSDTVDTKNYDDSLRAQILKKHYCLLSLSRLQYNNGRINFLPSNVPHSSFDFTSNTSPRNESDEDEDDHESNEIIKRCIKKVEILDHSFSCKLLKKSDKTNENSIHNIDNKDNPQEVARILLKELDELQKIIYTKYFSEKTVVPNNNIYNLAVKNIIEISTPDQRHISYLMFQFLIKGTQIQLLQQFPSKISQKIVQQCTDILLEYAQGDDNMWESCPVIAVEGIITAIQVHIKNYYDYIKRKIEQSHEYHEELITKLKKDYETLKTLRSKYSIVEKRYHQVISQVETIISLNEQKGVESYSPPLFGTKFNHIGILNNPFPFETTTSAQGNNTNAPAPTNDFRDMLAKSINPSNIGSMSYIDILNSKENKETENDEYYKLYQSGGEFSLGNETPDIRNLDQLKSIYHTNG